MTYNHLDECFIRLYASGLIVIYQPHATGKRSQEQLSYQSKKKRKYTVNKSKVQSACIRCWQLKKSKNMLFLTYTFPFEPTEDEASKIWNLTLKNLKQNYNVKNYVWVKERQKSGRLHYHIILDRDRIGIINIQKSFNNHIHNVRCDVNISFNSVRLGKRPLIRSISAVAKYLCKYISKSHGEFETKCYGYTTGLQISRIITTDELCELHEKFGTKTLLIDNFFELYRVNCDYIELKFDNYENSS